MATVSMKCPNCGGELIFDPKSQKYKCEYCGSDFALDEISTEEAATQAVSDVVQEREDTSDNHTQQRTAGAEDAAVLYICPSCGAQIVTDQTTAATFCYYCHNPVLLSEQLSGAFHPDQIIPFEIDRKQAEEHFLDFVHKKKFVPNAFFQKNQIEKLTGIYFPYWVCDAEVEGSLTAEGNKVRVWVSGDEEFTETRIYRMEREGHVSLREITKHALKKTDNLLAEGVLPYDFSKAAEFRMGYLSGFYAEKRDIERKELEEEVHREVENCTRDLLEDTIHGYNGVHILSDHIRPIREQWKYTLLPVWTVTFYQEGKPDHSSVYDADQGIYRDVSGNNVRLLDLKDILLAIVVGGVVCAGFCLFITGKYRLKFGRYRYNAREHATVKLRTNEDHFVRQYVTRRKIPKDPPKNGDGGNTSTVHQGAGGRTFGGGGRGF